MFLRMLFTRQSLSRGAECMNKEEIHIFAFNSRWPKGRPEQLDKKSCKQNHYGFAKVLEKEMEKYELSRHVDGFKKPVTAEEGPGDNRANE